MATLVYSDSDGRDRSFALGTEPVTVGRAPECTIRSEDPRVSRMHARFFLDQGGLWIEDLGSTHGIYVGSNKVSRAPVPAGEVVLIGSLLIRLVPASGTMPPPMGLHGTLATWLDLERKNRAAVEEERDAFAKRVGDLHQELAAARAMASGPTLKPEDALDTHDGTDTHPAMAAEAVRLRDEAEARAAALERALAAVQDELLVVRQTANPDEDAARLRAELAIARDRLLELERDLADRAEWSTLVGQEQNKLAKELDQVKVDLDEARSAQSVAEHAHAEAARESRSLREEIEKLGRATQADLEQVRLDAAKARDGKNLADTSAGMQAAEKLAEADLVIENLKRELAEAKLAPVAIVPAESDARVQELTELVAAMTARAERAEKELGSAQIRAQGAERNLSHANSQAANAETRVAQLEQRLEDAAAATKLAEDEAAKARERIAALETRVGAGDAPVEAAEARAAKIAADLAAVTNQFETSRGRIVELEGMVAAAEQAKREADTRGETARAEIAAAQAKLGEAERRAGDLQSKLDGLSNAEAAIAAAAKVREEAASRASAAETKVTEAVRRMEDAEKRASAADTMAKAMAKDVAEALRRAADGDTHKRSGARELADLMRRVEQAEAKNATSGATIQEAEDRATQAEARCEQLQAELATALASTQEELGIKLAAMQKELSVKLEAAQRELAAERKSSLALVDRKTQLERDLADARAQLPALVERAEAAERRVVEHEVQVETLQDRILDLESSLAVAETARQASLAEAGAKLVAIEKDLAITKQAAGKGGELVVEARAKATALEARVAELVAEVEASARACAEAEAALGATRAEMAGMVHAAEGRATATDAERARLEEALRRASDAEREIEALTARADEADMAIGRAGALQRQLDESLEKLAWLEREARAREVAPARDEETEAILNDRLATAERRASELAMQLAQAADIVEQNREQMRELLHRAALAEEASSRVGESDRRAVAAEAMLHEAEQRADDAEARLAEAVNRQAPMGGEMLERQLFDAQRKIAELEREVANADNVRSFAAETEREIAQLQRDLRDARANATQAALERDRLAADLRDARGDSETTNRRAPLDRKQLDGDYDPEVTAQADLSKYEPIIAKANELQQRVVELDKQNAAIRKQLADTEQQLREAIDRDDEDAGAEQTHTGGQLPIAFVEHLNVLEESIDSLRANMRAASDETAMMEQSDSVIAVSSAVSQAAEHIERARASIRAMNSSIGLA